MLERDGYPPGVPCWVETWQADPDAAIAFYGDLFGWEFAEGARAGAPQRYFVAQLRGRDVAGVGSRLDGAPHTPAWNTHICVESADETAAKTRDAGGRVLVEPIDVSDAGRMSVLSDPAGAVFCIWQPAEHKSAQLVNEPGTWNFSELNTPDPEGAKDFYGALFGWKATTLGPGAADSGFWRVSGYGDFLAQRDPGMLERQADVGAPEGFEDAVAWLVPMTSERFPDGTPAHWSITFAVDDADAMADRAAKLGGKVLAPPADAPWVRMTVLGDPEGAVFTASKFTPPNEA
jgi:predicted enzyme related to lactoylglutathione lyase